MIISPQGVTVTKAAGLEQPFDEAKLRASLLRAGASEELVQRVVREVHRALHQGARTAAIRRVVMRTLKREARHTAARYDLKRAIIRLGPSGFPFERYWGALLGYLGFDVAYDVMLQGVCIRHEIDVVATKTGETRLAECKFHNKSGRCTETRVALATYARSLDLRPPAGRWSFELVTNTRFTTEALEYGQCVGLGLVSWDHPQGGSLRELVDRHALYPISCLTTLKPKDLGELLHRGIVLCRDVAVRPTLLEPLDLPPRAKDAILEEVRELQQLGDVLHAANSLEVEGAGVRTARRR